MTPASNRKSKKQARRSAEKSRLPLSVTRREGKTTIRQLAGRRVIRMGEVSGKVVAFVELFTSKQDSHSLNIRFRDQTTLHLMVSPGFTINAEYYKSEGMGDPKVLKRWPQIRSEQLP